MSSIVSIDTRGYDISMGPGMLRVGGGGGLAGNVYINGNVGIGKANPTRQLDVSGSMIASGTINAGLYVTNGSFISESSTANTGHIRVSASGSANYIQSGLTATSGSSAPLYFTDIYAANRWMTITSSGSVGIGTTFPSRLLDVRGDAQIGVSTNKCIEIISGTTDLTYINFHSKDALYNNYDTRITSTGGGTSSQPQRGNLLYSALNHAFNTGGIDRMTITSSGSVGIGTTSPTVALDVSGRLQVRSPGYSSTLNNTQTTGVITHASQTLSAVGWYSAMTWNTLMATTGWSQSVVIGSKRDSLTTFGSAVIGVGNADNTINIEYLFHSNGNFYANGTAYSSDIRLKQNIVDADLNICYNNVKKLKLKRWEWRNNINGLYKNDQHQLGWIAQELEQISPKSVTSINMYEIDDCKHIENTQVISFMYGTIQKLQDITENQQQQIDEHKNQLQTQQSIIQSLEQRLSLLEQRLS